MDHYYVEVQYIIFPLEAMPIYGIMIKMDE
jgi:hypothetical protein